jgi:hypothetical protein
MVKPLLELAIVGVVLLILYVRVRLKHTTPLYLGLAIIDLCVVSAEEISAYIKAQERIEKKGIPPHLVRKVRRQKCRVLFGHTKGKMLNSTRFQAIGLFEMDKIDKTKSSLQYQGLELQVLELVNTATEMRLRIFRTQANLVIRGILGLYYDHTAMMQLLHDYKALELAVRDLTQFSPDPSYYGALSEHLGLTEWGTIRGRQGQGTDIDDDDSDDYDDDGPDGDDDPDHAA